MFRSYLVAAFGISVSCLAVAQQTLVFAVNEGVTYRTGADASRQNYKAIADDLARLLKTKVRVDVVGEYAALEKDLAAKSCDIAFIHPTHIAIAPVKRGDYTLVAGSKAHINYKASFLSNVRAEPKPPAELGALLASGTKMIGFSRSQLDHSLARPCDTARRSRCGQSVDTPARIHALSAVDSVQGDQRLC